MENGKMLKPKEGVAENSARTIILIEKKGKTHFTKFIGLFKNRPEIPIKEIRTCMPKSTFYTIVLGKIYAINQSIKNIDPGLEPFISIELEKSNGRIVQTFRRGINFEIIDSDPNFFYLMVK